MKDENNLSLDTVYKTVEELLEKAKTANNMRVGDLIHDFKFNKMLGKGQIGQIVEEELFGYKNNSKKEADFSNLGVELKVTGLIERKNKSLAMKERLVLNIINYYEEANVEFLNSSFWKKNAKLLIMFYHFKDKNEDFKNFRFLDSILHTFDEKDLEIIKNDYQIIQDKINSGRAHEISEADTYYLGACTKGATRESSYRKQPYSETKAPQRAYCLKASYMNSVVEKCFGHKTIEELVSYDELQNNTFESIIENRLKKYVGHSEKELFSYFKINDTSKDKFNLLLAKMLGICGDINKTEEFQKAGIEAKTIRVEENGKIKEHMSFPKFSFVDIINQDFFDSDIYEIFATKKFMFSIFKKRNNEYCFEKVVFWNMPYEDIFNYVRPVFDQTKQVVASGNIVKEIKGDKYITNFIKPSFNNICHVRPHDTASIQKTNKGDPLPVADKLTGRDRYTKHCFWLDSSYIKSVIKC